MNKELTDLKERRENLSTIMLHRTEDALIEYHKARMHEHHNKGEEIEKEWHVYALADVNDQKRLNDLDWQIKQEEKKSIVESELIPKGAIANVFNITNNECVTNHVDNTVDNSETSN